MLYTDYYKKFSKLVSAMRFVKRHWIPILIAALAVVALAVTLTSTKGLVYDKTPPPTDIVYGEEFNYEAGAFITGKIAYEYRADGSDEWTDEMPKRAGKYYVRAISYRAFGAPSYGKEYGFTIAPKPVDVRVESPTVFGEHPQVNAELCYGDTISCDGFVYGDLSLSETTVRAILGSVKITDTDGADVTGSYTLNAPEFGITFVRRRIQITVADTSEKYDGNPHGFGGIEITDGSLASGDVITAIFDETLTEVGEIDVEPEFVITSKTGVNVTGNYDIDVKPGKLEIERQILTIKTPSASKVYDGKELFCIDGYELTGGKLADGHELVLSENNYSRITNAGTVKNTMSFTVSNGDDDVTENYAIALEPGTLEVTPRTVAAVTADGTWVYDGKAHGKATASAVTVVGVLTGLGHGWSVAENATITDVGTCDNTVTLKFFDGDGKDVSKNYSVTLEPGTLEVTKRPITVETNSGTWVYDGIEHSNNGYAVRGLVSGHGTEIVYQARIKDVVRDGDTVTGIANEFEVTVKYGGKDVTANYEITYVFGTLTVTPRPVTLKAGSDGKVYDDTPLTVNGYEDMTEGQADRGILKKLGHYASVVCDGTITDVGTADNRIISFDILSDGVSVSGNYAVSVSDTPGTLTVEKRVITVVTASGTWMYDGYAHSKNEIVGVEKAEGTDNDPPLVSDHVISTRDEKGDYTVLTDVVFDFNGDVASVDNSVVPMIKSGDIDKTGNYGFIFRPGTLTVTPRPVSVRPVEKTKVYDDTPLASNDFEVISDIDLADNETGIAVCDGTITDVLFDANGNVAHVDNNIVAFTVMHGDRDVTNNYIIMCDIGKLTVTPREIVLTSRSRVFYYNGVAQSCKEYIVTSAYETALAAGHKERVTEYATVTLVSEGTVENRLIIVVEKNGDDKTKNYGITYVYGDIAVDRLPVTVTCGSRGAYGDGDWVYDGEAHSYSGFTFVSNAAGIAVPKFDVFAFDGTKKYSSISAVVRNEDGSVGTVQNFFYVSVTETLDDGSTVDKSDNYAIDYIGGKLTLNPRPITVRTASAEFIYNGSEQAIKSDDAIESVTSVYAPPLLDGHILSPVYDVYPGVHLFPIDVRHDENGNVLYENGKIAGYENPIKKCIIRDMNMSRSEVTGNYEITFEYGTITILPVPVTVATDDFTTKYNGKPHADTYFTITSEYAIPDKESCSVDMEKSVAYITDVLRDGDGNVIGKPNKFSVKFMRDGENINYNYDVTYDYGELKLLPIEVAFTTGSASKPFDGEPLTCPVASIIGDPFLDGHVGTIAATGTRTFAGSSPNTAKLTVTDEASARDVTHNYEPVPSEDDGGVGTLTVTSIKIKIKTASASKVYDGKPLENETYEILSGGVLDGHALKVEFGDGLTSAGSKQNTVTPSVTRVSDGADMTGGYEFEYEFGTLTVTKRELTVTRLPGSWIYDGKPHYGEIDSVYGGDGLASGQTLSPYAVTVVIDVGSTPNRTAVKIVNGEDNNVTANYDITYLPADASDAMLEITPRKITVTTGGNSWMYDGENHSEPTFEITGGTLADGQTAEYLDGTATEIKYVGTAQNKLQILIADADGNAVTTNYNIEWRYGTLQVKKRPVWVETASDKWLYDGEPHSNPNGEVDMDSPNPLVDGDSIRGENCPTISEVGKKPNNYELHIYDSEGKDVTYCYDPQISYGTLEVCDDESGDGSGEGEGGGGGDGSGNTGGYGGSGGLGDGSGEPRVIMSIRSDYEGRLYLRNNSLGKYVLGRKESFDSAKAYSFTLPDGDGRYAYTYLASAAIRATDATAQSVDIKLEHILNYALPYYVGFDTNAQTSDVLYAGKSLEYTATFYPQTLGDMLVSVPEEYAAYERKYAEFVKNNYTDIPASTLESMRTVIAMQNIDASLASGATEEKISLIQSVARFVQTAATYDLEYDRALDESYDPAVEFLLTYKRGICQHYAKSATMLFRALGLPARYTVGVVADSDGSGEWQEVMNTQAHAWVEVYLDGIGWVPVEVTGGGPGGNGGDGDFNGGGDGEIGSGGNGEEITSFKIKPLDVYVEEGNVARPVNAVVDESGKLQSWLKKGYGYSVSVTGERSELGTGYSTITRFVMYDNNGADVTDKFDIGYLPGLLCVTKPQIGVYVYRTYKRYDGKPIKFGENDYYVENCPSGYELTLNFSEISLDFGAMSIETLREHIKSFADWYTVTDANGNDVTAEFADDYFVLPYIDVDVETLKKDMSEIYVLEVAPRALSVKSNSDVKIYDGTPLKGSSATVTDGSLLKGHTVKYTFESEITDVGETLNVFYAEIFDADGVDVTYMYDVTYTAGTLEVVYE